MFNAFAGSADDPVPRPNDLENCQTVLAVAMLLLMGVVAVGGRIYLLLSPFHMDEYDYLFVSRMFSVGDTWPTLTYVFGADFNWHLLGWAQSLTDSPLGARFAAAFLGVLSLGALYHLVMAVWHSRVQAIISVFLLGASASHIYISSIATYDVIAFCLFSWAMVALVKLLRIENLETSRKPGSESTRKRAWSRRVGGITAKYEFRLLFVSALLLTLAVLSKYVLILYLPVLFVLVLVFRARYAIPGLVLIGGCLGLYFWLNMDALLVLYNTQILITQSANITRIELLLRMVSIAGWTVTGLLAVYLIYLSMRPTMIPGSFSAGMETRSGNKSKTTSVVLVFLLLALPLPVYHVASSNQIAMVKHLGYFFFFICPLLALALVKLLQVIGQHARPYGGQVSRVRMTASVFALGSVFVLIGQSAISNVKTSADLGRSVADLSAAAAYWQEQHSQPDSSGKILSEDPYLFRYAAYPFFPQSFISETTYLDNDLDGKVSSRDVRDAIWDQKFTWVLLTDQIHPEENVLYRRLLSLRDYVPVVRNPYYLTPLLSGNQTGLIELYQLQSAAMDY